MFPPKQKEEVKDTLVFSACLHLCRGLAIMKKVRKKLNSIISSTHFCSVTATTQKKKVKLNSPKRRKNPRTLMEHIHLPGIKG